MTTFLIVIFLVLSKLQQSFSCSTNLDCSGHGHCINTTNFTGGVCLCDSGWTSGGDLINDVSQQNCSQNTAAISTLYFVMIFSCASSLIASCSKLILCFIRVQAHRQSFADLSIHLGKKKPGPQLSAVVAQKHADSPQPPKYEPQDTPQDTPRDSPLPVQPTHLNLPQSEINRDSGSTQASFVLLTHSTPGHSTSIEGKPHPSTSTNSQGSTRALYIPAELKVDDKPRLGTVLDGSPLSPKSYASHRPKSVQTLPFEVLPTLDDSNQLTPDVYRSNRSSLGHPNLAVANRVVGNDVQRLESFLAMEPEQKVAKSNPSPMKQEIQSLRDEKCTVPPILNTHDSRDSLKLEGTLMSEFLGLRTVRFALLALPCSCCLLIVAIYEVIPNRRRTIGNNLETTIPYFLGQLLFWSCSHYFAWVWIRLSIKLVRLRGTSKERSKIIMGRMTKLLASSLCLAILVGLPLIVMLAYPEKMSLLTRAFFQANAILFVTGLSTIIFTGMQIRSTILSGLEGSELHGNYVVIRKQVASNLVRVMVYLTVAALINFIAATLFAWVPWLQNKASYYLPVSWSIAAWLLVVCLSVLQPPPAVVSTADMSHPTSSYTPHSATNSVKVRHIRSQSATSGVALQTIVNSQDPTPAASVSPSPDPSPPTSLVPSPSLTPTPEKIGADALGESPVIINLNEESSKSSSTLSILPFSPLSITSTQEESPKPPTGAFLSSTSFDGHPLPMPNITVIPASTPLGRFSQIVQIPPSISNLSNSSGGTTPTPTHRDSRVLNFSLVATVNPQTMSTSFTFRPAYKKNQS